MKKHGKGHVMPEKRGLDKGPRSTSRPGKGGKMIPKTGMGVDNHTLGRTAGLTNKPMG